VIDSAIARFWEVICWLWNNGLEANPSKTELITFTNTCQLDLTGGNILEARPTPTDNITMTTSLRYLGVFITNNLDWMLHVKTMVSCAKSTIRGVSILGNSV